MKVRVHPKINCNHIYSHSCPSPITLFLLWNKKVDNLKNVSYFFQNIFFCVTKKKVIHLGLNIM